MTSRPITIAVVAPSRPITKEIADAVRAAAQTVAAEDAVELRFHDQCFIEHGHFAGDDETRARAFVEAAEDPTVDAVWLARGGYGAGRLPDTAFDPLTDVAREKTYVGYSDAGFILARLYARGFPHLVHGPMAGDSARRNGAEATARTLRFLANKDAATLEGDLKDGETYAAFNVTVLAHLVGRADAPDLSGHILLLEDVDEYHYALDRAMGAIFTSRLAASLKGVRLGRCAMKPNVERRNGVETEVRFGATAEEIAAFWCARAGAPYLGRADIGHDADNKLVPFGVFKRA
ncbi:MAG: LD-carboxypeptidase [Pseudomonadota bacterium]